MKDDTAKGRLRAPNKNTNNSINYGRKALVLTG